MRRFIPLSSYGSINRSFQPIVEYLESRYAPALMAGLGTGLVADFYSDPGFTNLAATRTDPTVNFNWTSAPASGVSANNFSARWTGLVQAQASESYTFSVLSAGGVRLWINDRLVVEDWTEHAPSTRNSAPIALTAGETYTLRLEYSDTAAPAALRLQWSSPSTPLSDVPASQLYGKNGWLDAELGSSTSAGSISSTGSVYTVSGGGGATNTADRGHFLYQSLGGDGTVVARVTSNPGGAAGVMLRGNLDPSGPGVTLTVAAGQGAVFQYRNATGSFAIKSSLSDVGSLAWVKLVRDGDVVSGYASSTGQDGSWRLVGSATVPMGSSALAGLTAISTGGAGTVNTATFTNVAVTPTVALGANLGAINYWSISNVFVDMVKQANFFAPGSSNPATVDANGWPTQDFRVYLQTDAGNLYSIYNGTYHVSFTGRADVSLFATEGKIGPVTYDPATNRTTLDVTLNVSGQDPGWIFAMNFANTNGGVRDLKVIRPGYDANTTQVFTNEYINAVRPFTVLRFMDWSQTNNNPVKTWAERSHVTDATQATNKGAAWEYAIDLANQTGKDIWINIPEGATRDYVIQLATLLRTRLNPDRVVYIENSNEVWNGIFSQYHTNLNAAVAEVTAGMSSGTPSNLYYPGEDSRRADGSWTYQNYWAARRYARRTVEIAQDFASVWGTGSVPQRVRPVLNGQLVNPFMLNLMLSYLNERIAPPSTYLYAVAGTTYLSTHALDGQTNPTTDQILAALADSVVHEETTYLPYTTTATAYGLRHFASEGGVDTFGPNGIAAKAAASLDPRITGLITTFLDNWREQGGQLFNWYVAGATTYDTRFGTWGLTNNPTNVQTPKYQAINSVADSPPPAVVAGTPIPNALPASTTSPYVGNVPTGTALDYLVRSPSSGTYSLVLNYAAINPGQVQVIVNGRVATTVSLPVTGSSYDSKGAPTSFANRAPFNLQLVEGLNDIRLVAVTGGFSLRTLTFAAVGGVVSPPPPPPPASSPPSIVTQASASPSPVTGTTVNLSTLGSDDGGESALIYSWSLTQAPAGAPAVTYSANGTNSAKNTTATFALAGSYTFRVTATDANGQSATSNVTVVVNQALTSVSVTPATAQVQAGGTTQFNAQALDQFGKPMAATPTFTWSASAGSVSSTGLYTAPAQATTATVTAQTGGRTGTAAVTVSTSTGGGATVDYSSGFTSTGLAINGAASVAGSSLRLAPANRTWAAGSAYAASQVNVAAFSTQFTFQMTGNANMGDGLAFVLQRQGATAVGGGGAGVGSWGVGWSVALTFNLGDSGTGAGSVGLYKSGAAPFGPNDLSLATAGLNLRSGHAFNAAITYDGTTLRLTLTDTVTGASMSTAWAINIPGTVGGSTAFVGFTGATGDRTANIDILNWKYGPQSSSNQPPTVTASGPGSTNETTAALTATGSDDGGESALIYSWSLTQAPAGAPAVTYSANGTNSAKNTTATFALAGSYTFRVTATDANGQSATSNVTVVVNQTLTSVSVTPATAQVQAGGTTQFNAQALDQFGKPMAATPTFTWSASAGSVSSTGLYTAPAQATTATVTAQTGGRTGTASVSVTSSTGGGATVDYSSGFTSTGLAINGAASVAGNSLRLAPANRTWAAGSAYAASQVNVAAFSTQFTFQMTGNANMGDGLAFVLQRQGATAVGGGGAGVGSWGVGWSVALTFNLGDSGTGAGSVGLYKSGAAPFGPNDISLATAGLNLRSGHAFNAAITYDGTTLRLTLTDTVTGTSMSTAWAINIPGTVGGSTAFVGFTGATGDRTANIDILNWKYQAG